MKVTDNKWFVLVKPNDNSMWPDGSGKSESIEKFGEMDGL